MGEWNRDWSDMSSQWTDSLEKILGRSAVNDGTFWIDAGFWFQRPWDVNKIPRDDSFYD